MKHLRYKYILYIPILFLIYSIWDVYKFNHSLRDLASHTEVIHNFILAEFITMMVILELNFFHEINRIIKKNLDISIIILIIFLLKLNMLYISNISLNIIYLFQIFTNLLIEIFPIFLIKTFLSNHTNKLTIFTYFLILNIIIILNIGIYIYYYNTFELIEPIIYSNINIESIEGYFIDINNIQILFILLLAIIFNLLIYFLFKKGLKSINTMKKKKISSFLILLISLLAIYNLLFLLDKYTARKVLPLYDATRVHKDIQVNKICQNSLYTYLKSFYEFKHPKKLNLLTSNITFTKQDLTILNKLNLYNNSQNSLYNKKYNKIILIIFESLSIDFLHYYNDKIPSNVTPYFNHLLQEYFHLNNFYTSNMPTDYGMTAILKSKLDLNENSDSIFKYFKEYNYSTYLINAVSQYYGIMGKYYPKAFDPYEWIYKEKLENEYGDKSSGWGFHNNILYDKALKIIHKNNHKRLLMAIKTIDFHQPGTYVPHSIKNEYPNEDRKFQTLRWLDNQLKKFIKKISLDDKTLIIITSDHSPNPGADFEKYAITGNFQRLAKLPLIFITKNHDFSTFYHLENNPYSQVDLLPTILSINNIKFDNKKYFGNNIFSSILKPRLSKYENILYYEFKNKHFECYLESSENNETCSAIKKYYLNVQNLK